MSHSLFTPIPPSHENRWIINDKAYKKLHANQLSSWGSWRNEVWEKYITCYTDTVIWKTNSEEVSSYLG